MVYKPIAKCWNFVNLEVWPTPSGRGGTNLCLSIGLAKPWGEACVGWSDTSEAREFTGEEGAQVEVVRELLVRIIFGSEIASYKSCTEVSWKLDPGWWLVVASLIGRLRQRTCEAKERERTWQKQQVQAVGWLLEPYLRTRHIFK